MSDRKPLTPQTIEAMAAQLADLPVAPEKAKAHAEALEPLMEMIACLRSLPLKEVEPAVIFAPEED